MASILSRRSAPKSRARMRALSPARMRALLLTSALLAPALLAPQAASAYVGPGAGLTAIGGMLALVAAKPEKAPKGKYFLSASLSSTMGPGVPVDVDSLDPASPRFFRESEGS